MATDTEKLVKIINFWHESLNRGNLLEREKFHEIELSGKEIVDIIGPRRSGKSSLLKLVIRHIRKVLGRNDFLYVNFEDPFFIEHNEATVIEDIIAVYKEYFNKDLHYLFFDEIQSIKHWEKAIRKLRDGEDYKILITGSSSTLLSRELASLITGRHTTKKLLPLTFREFLTFNDLNISSEKDLLVKDQQLFRLFDDYLDMGGFPEIVLSGNKELLKNYFYDFLQKDVVIRHDVRDKEALEKMAVFLISNSSKVFSISSLAKSFDLSYQSAQNYLTYLKEAFLLFELPQFSYSLKKQSKALTKVYGVDIGLIKAVSFKFSEDRGRILENAVFLHLYNKFDELYYYKTKRGFEVDFLLKELDTVTGLVQVAWRLSDSSTKEREVRALVDAMKELNLTESTIVTYDETDTIDIDDLRINVIPAWRYFLGCNRAV